MKSKLFVCLKKTYQIRKQFIIKTYNILKLSNNH